MLKNDCQFGGENSGHLIFKKFSPIGDGIAAAIYLLAIIARKGIKLSALKTNIALFPQKSFNVAVGDKIPISEVKGLGGDIEMERDRLGPDGRVIARYSGTEPKLRVTVESDDEENVDHAWSNLQKSIMTRFGENDISASIS
jgi:phosphoglucosamine mutase